jgi:hypothetical protein
LSFMSYVDYFYHVEWIMELYWFHGHFFFWVITCAYFFIYIWFFFLCFLLLF